MTPDLTTWEKIADGDKSTKPEEQVLQQLLALQDAPPHVDYDPAKGEAIQVVRLMKGRA